MIKRLYALMLRHGLRVLGICGLCFFIEACYGTPQADYSDAPLKDTDVTGTIRTEDGAVAPNIPVMLTNGRFGDTIRTFSDNDGRYTFFDVRYSAQPYHLIIQNHGGKRESVDFRLRKDEVISDKKLIDIVLKS